MHYHLSRMTDSERVLRASAAVEALSIAPLPEVEAPRAPSRLAWVWRGLLRAGWAPSLVFAVHVVLDQGFHLYGRFPKLDMPMHVTGGLAISVFLLGCWREAVGQGVAGRPARGLTPVIVVLSTAMATILWEFAEFGSDRLLKTSVQTSVDDTLADILLGSVSFEGQTTIAFDELGVPYYYDPNTNTTTALSVSNGSVIPVICGEFTVTIKIEPYTGEIKVEERQGEGSKMIRFTRAQVLPIGVDIGHDSVKMLQCEVIGDDLSVTASAKMSPPGRRMPPRSARARNPNSSARARSKA